MSEKDKKNNDTAMSCDQSDEEAGYATTVQLSRKSFNVGISIKHQAYLEMLGSEEREIIKLSQSEFLIGRSPSCNIQLSHDNVSRLHSRVVFQDEEYMIEDLNSTNGTYVNGINVSKCILRSNDIIEIGGAKMIFYEEKKAKKA